jgi:hypothetical protein
LVATTLWFLVSAPSLGCEGYADLPLDLRESGDLTIVSVQRFSMGPGKVEITLAPPTDATGPFTIVGHPGSLTAGATVLTWALGGCDQTASPAAGLRLCLAVQFTADAEAAPLVLGLVLESRGDGRRFTLLGAEGGL